MFVFKGISNEDMNVVIEEEEQFLGKASQRYSQTDIEGYNGAYFEEEGYSTIERPIKIQILDDEKLDKIFKWLDGAGELEYKGRITKARFYADLDAVRSSSIKIIETNFIRDPFWYKKRDDYVEIKNMVTNEGTIYSEPLIRIEKKQSDKIDLTINDIRFVYNFKGEEYCEIDCYEGIATYNNLNRNRQLEIGYIFPKLQPGENKIVINSGDATIKFRRKDRWL